MDTSQLLFNIIFTPGTVSSLSPFIKSLLKYSDCRFRIISNGCPEAERRYLRILCSKEPRLEYLTFPTVSMKSHGLVLNYLQALDRNRPYFCFMDSDILAKGNFLDKIMPLMDNHAAFFSGTPIWLNNDQCVLPDSFDYLGGFFNKSENGLCLGSTYFAIYNGKMLNDLMQETGIGFEHYNFTLIPENIMNILKKMGMAKRFYDTAKILNLLLQHRGEKLIYHEIEDLVHIGGPSVLISKEQKEKVDLSWKRKYLIKLLGEKLGNNLINKLTELEILKSEEELLQVKYKKYYINNESLKIRESIIIYIMELIKSYQSDTSFPLLPDIEDIKIKNKFIIASEAVSSLYKEESGRSEN
jgi:hypothetical protein